MNKKSRLLIYVVVLILGSLGVFFNIGNNTNIKKQVHELKKAPLQAQVVLYTKPMECVLDRITVKKVSNNHEVQGSNYLKAWLIEFNTHNGLDFEANQIVNTEDPLSMGQDYFVASSCKEIKRPETASSDCTGIYLWDSLKMVISRQCGQILDEKVVFLK